MAVDYSKFDKVVDVEGLKKDLAEAEKNDNTGSYEDVPAGLYEVKIEKLELVASKKGDPMMKCWFKILEGEHKGRLIFMNQVVVQGFQLKIANQFLRELDSGIDVKFDNYAQYGNMLLDIHEAISGKLEYGLQYGQDKKGFNTFSITDVYDVE